MDASSPSPGPGVAQIIDLERIVSESVYVGFPYANVGLVDEIGQGRQRPQT